MIDPRPVLIRFAGMFGLSAAIWVAAGLVYAAVADVPARSVLLPSTMNLVVVLLVCLGAALPWKNR